MVFTNYTLTELIGIIDKNTLNYNNNKIEKYKFHISVIWEYVSCFSIF
jgi:hypothetical protein